MKKKPAIIIFIIGLFVAVSVVGAVKFIGGGDVDIEEEIAPEIPAHLRPFTSLTPSEDGHFLSLLIEDIQVEGAATVDYELVYTVADGRQQGVPGSALVSKGDSVEKELLLGSESAGKKRFDEGVEMGTLTLRFRNDNGKLVGKLTTDFALLQNTDVLSSPDGSFSYALDTTPDDVFFVVVNTFGQNDDMNIAGTNYAIFSSDGETYEGSAL